MGQLGGIVVAYLAVVVVGALLAGIPQTLGAGLYRGIRWFFRLLQRDPWFARGMLVGVLAAMMALVIWDDYALPVSVLTVLFFVLVGLGIVVILAQVSVAPRRDRWILVGGMAVELAIVIWDDNPLPMLPVFLGLWIVLILARVFDARRPGQDKKRSGAR